MGSKMMKAASLLLAASLLTGCSVTNTASGTPEASGEAVSGSVAAEERKEDLAGRSRNYLENSDNRYDIKYDEDKDIEMLVQYKLDGTKIKETKTDIEELEWVTDEWLYYSVEDKEENEILWRIPIRKTEKGDKLLTDKKEKVRKAESINVDYATDSYLILEIYGDSGKEGEAICKYDCKTGRMTELIPEKEEVLLECLWGEGYPIMWEGDLFYAGDDLYRLNPETGEHLSVYTFKLELKESESIEDYALARGKLYFLIEEVDTENKVSYKLYRYDCASGKKECMLSNREFVKAVEKLKLGKLQGIDIDGLYLDQDRLFFDIYIEFSKKKTESGEKVYYEKSELFSIQLRDSEEIQHEDELMDYLDKKGKYVKYQDGNGRYGHHTSWIEGCLDGRILASYHKGRDGASRYVLYDLETREIKDMTEKELAEKYQELLYD